MSTKINLPKLFALSLGCLLVAMTLAPATGATPIAPPQDTTTLQNDTTVYQIEEVDVKPEYPGGINKLSQFVKNKLRYPMEAADRNIQGRVIVHFTIKADGKIDDIKVLDSIHRLLDREAMRIVRAMPKWTPGELNGKKVAVRFIFPITFQLNKDKAETK
jgi:TonB family protein